MRCPICENLEWHVRRDGRQCSHCELYMDRHADPTAVLVDIRRQLASGSTGNGAGWRLDRIGWRNTAWRLGYVLDGEAVLKARRRSHTVALGIIARLGDARIHDLLDRTADDFGRRLVLFDGDDGGALCRRHENVDVAVHPLADDFGAQRNRLQRMAGTGWVLQLDTDECPTPELLAALGWLTAAADRDGLHSLGLPRRNMVDGRWSALYPDIQYRLNRAEVRFAGRVHERPDVPFARTSLALCGAIDHHLSEARVRERTRIYESMERDAGRVGDEAALLRPFVPAAMASR